VPFDFHLNLSQDKMAWLYSQADLFVSAEKRAGWSNTTAEAMACKIPVLCTKSGTQDFAVHDETAFTIPYAHPFLLRLGIKRMIEDKELRFRLARSGYEKILEFTWSSVADTLEGIFQKELNKKS
jgi:glycosyltransferase involved in cell wall biosynthesis